MQLSNQTSLAHKRILIVEDEWQAATEIAQAFESYGADVIGPVPAIEDAMETLARDNNIDGAIIDINLRGELAYPVADELIARGIPFLFATGYSHSIVPKAYRSVPLCEKPFQPKDVVRVWSTIEAQAQPLKVSPDSLLRNRLTARLDATASSRLLAQLQPVQLPARAVVSGQDGAGRWCCFLSEGLASTSITNHKRESVEAGVIGQEGVTGLGALWDDRPALNRSVMLTKGAGWKISVDALRELCESNAGLERLLWSFSDAFLFQVSNNLLAASRYRVEQRVARWLSLVCDRIGSPIPISHEMIATLLGVRRAGVTLALNKLRDLGCITYGRREIFVLNRQALTAACGGCYGAADVMN